MHGDKPESPGLMGAGRGVGARVAAPGVLLRAAQPCTCCSHIAQPHGCLAREQGTRTRICLLLSVATCHLDAETLQHGSLGPPWAGGRQWGQVCTPGPLQLCRPVITPPPPSLSLILCPTDLAAGSSRNSWEREVRVALTLPRREKKIPRQGPALAWPVAASRLLGQGWAWGLGS